MEAEEGSRRLWVETLAGEGDIPAWVASSLELPGLALKLPSAVAHLCAHGVFGTVAVPDFTSTSGDGWSMGWQGTHGGPRVGPTRRGFEVAEEAALAARKGRGRSLMDPDFAYTVANEIRSLCRHLGDAVPDATHALLADVQQHIDSLRRMRSACPDTGTHPRGRAYNVFTLLNCFWLCGLLKNDAKLSEAVELAICISFPKVMAEQALRFVRGDRPAMAAPSASTICRTRGRIDVAWMLTWRRRRLEWLQGGGLSIYPQVDSSPQGGAGLRNCCTRNREEKQSNPSAQGLSAINGMARVACGG